MRELFNQLAAYHIWANQLLLNVVDVLTAEQQKVEVKSSFGSLFQTALHMWNAESVWWQRMKLHERVLGPAENFSGEMTEISHGLLQQNKQWQDWITNAQEHMLLHEFIYYNSKKEKFKQPVYQMLIHLFNHGTYHRGQLVNILRQLDVEKIPSTDFIVWSRKKTL